MVSQFEFNKEGGLKSFQLFCIVQEIIQLSISKDLMNCSHPREEEYVSRRPVKISSGGSDNRIEPEAGNQEFLFQSEYRPVGYEREQKDFIVLLFLIRPVKLDCQCTQGAMEQNGCLFISPISVDPLVPQKVRQ